MRSLNYSGNKVVLTCRHSTHIHYIPSVHPTSTRTNQRCYHMLFVISTCADLASPQQFISWAEHSAAWRHKKCETWGVCVCCTTRDIRVSFTSSVHTKSLAPLVRSTPTVKQRQLPSTHLRPCDWSFTVAAPTVCNSLPHNYAQPSNAFVGNKLTAHVFALADPY